MGAVALGNLPCCNSQVDTMDVRAILLIGGKPEASSEHFGGVPLAMLDLLGASLLNRVAHRMHRQGIGSIAVISEYDQFPDRNLSPDLRWFKASNGQFWRYAEAVFNDFAQNGAELIVVLRLGSYVNIDYEMLVQFHLDRHSRLTQACDKHGEALDLFVISASRRNDAAFIFRNMLDRFRVPPDVFHLDDRQNRLQTIADFRRLALESFAGKNGIEPQGVQIKPGVWVAPGARIHREARIVAPAYIGAYARVRALAVVTRGSVIERNSGIDCGTVVENSTVLPFSQVGAGLDVSFSVVGFRHIFHLQRQVDVEIADERLIDMASTSATVRALSDMLSLALYMPKALLSNLREKRSGTPATLPEAIQAAPPSLSTATVEHQERADRHFAPELITARRYGNE
jgi:carbonic anhydrase/acetyltransferase-like protein (isoleucine patch superfamily)